MMLQSMLGLLIVGTVFNCWMSVGCIKRNRRRDEVMNRIDVALKAWVENWGKVPADVKQGILTAMSPSGEVDRREKT